MKKKSTSNVPPKTNPHKETEVNYLGVNGRSKSKENKDRNDKLNLGDGSSGH